MLNWITFPARFDSLAQICQYVQGAAQKAGFDSHAVYEIQLAVDEACANIIEHAYGGENRGEIECSCVAGEDGLEIRLHDHGKAFDPQKVRKFDPHQSLAKCRSGGAGLFLMHQVMDEVRFEFNADQGNTCILIKHTPQPPQQK